MILAHCQHETVLWSQNKKNIVGIDEVGRGAWAGPMVIGAVMLPPDQTPPFHLADSKLLSAKKRSIAEQLIRNYALAAKIFEVPLSYINQHGIGKATQFGYQSVLDQFEIPFDHLLIDAFKLKTVAPEKQTAIIKGDQQSASIAAASIIAKVYRDKLMQQLHQRFPLYNFAKNVGYGTKAHTEAIQKHGICELHRTSFRLPVVRT